MVGGFAPQTALGGILGLDAENQSCFSLHVCSKDVTSVCAQVLKDRRCGNAV